MAPFELSFGADPLTWPRWPLLLIATLAMVRVLLPKSSITVRDFGRELAIVISAYFLYFIVRGLVADRQFEAFDRASDVIAIERTMGIFWEVHLQDRIVDLDLAVNLVNWVYVWGHWPMIILFATWLFLRGGEDYFLYRNAFVISGAIGLIIFATLPVAPPRLMPAWGFVDTAEVYHLGPSASLLVNEYAAMPSLHFGWNLLLGIALFRTAESVPLKVIGATVPPAMFASIVLTGNHYILDGVAGGIVALMGLGAAYLMRHLTQKLDVGGPAVHVPST